MKKNKQSFFQTYKMAFILWGVLMLAYLAITLSIYAFKSSFLAIFFVIMFYVNEYLFAPLYGLFELIQNMGYSSEGPLITTGISTVLFILMIILLNLLFILGIFKLYAFIKNEPKSGRKYAIIALVVGFVLFYIPKPTGYSKALDYDQITRVHTNEVKECDCIGYQHKRTGAVPYSYDQSCYGIPLSCRIEDKNFGPMQIDMPR